MHSFTHVYPIERLGELLQHNGVRPPNGALMDIPFAFFKTTDNELDELDSIVFSNLLHHRIFKSPVVRRISTHSIIIEAKQETGERVVLFVQHEDYR